MEKGRSRLFSRPESGGPGYEPTPAIAALRYSSRREVEAGQVLKSLFRCLGQNWRRANRKIAPMFLHIGNPKKLGELQRSTISAAALRPRQRILVVDDQPFVLKDVLSSHGFSITEMRDIQSVDLSAAYPIVVCDIKGVGAALKGKHEGAHLFREIRRAFPEKYIIAFTGFRFDPTYNEYFRSADLSLKKDTDSEAWVTALDSAVKTMSDPSTRWLRLRKHLLDDAGLELWDVLRLEQAFIEAVESGDKQKLTGVLGSLRVPEQI